MDAMVFSSADFLEGTEGSHPATGRTSIDFARSLAEAQEIAPGVHRVFNEPRSGTERWRSSLRKLPEHGGHLCGKKIAMGKRNRNLMGKEQEPMVPWRFISETYRDSVRKQTAAPPISRQFCGRNRESMRKQSNLLVFEAYQKAKCAAWKRSHYVSLNIAQAAARGNPKYPRKLG